MSAAFGVDFNDHDICIDEGLSRDAFEDMITERLRAIEACIDSTLKNGRA